MYPVPWGLRHWLQTQLLVTSGLSHFGAILQKQQMMIHVNCTNRNRKVKEIQILILKFHSTFIKLFFWYCCFPSGSHFLALTVRNGGNVLVPCYPSGVIYDLLECLYQYIDSAGLSSIPFYFISPVANSSLEFSQIFAEWYVCVLLSEFYFDSIRWSSKTRNPVFFLLLLWNSRFVVFPYSMMWRLY